MDTTTFQAAVAVVSAGAAGSMTSIAVLFRKLKAAQEIGEAMAKRAVQSEIRGEAI